MMNVNKNTMKLFGFILALIGGIISYNLFFGTLWYEAIYGILLSTFGIAIWTELGIKRFKKIFDRKVKFYEGLDLLQFTLGFSTLVLGVSVIIDYPIRFLYPIASWVVFLTTVVFVVQLFRK